MINKLPPERLEDLEEKAIYRTSDLKRILANYNIPNTQFYLRKIRKMGYLNSGFLPTGSGEATSHKIYTGKMIVECVRRIIEYVENGSKSRGLAS